MRFFKLILFSVIFLQLSFNLVAQTENIGIGTTSPDNSAVLHVQYVSTPKGILIPRMTTAQRNSIPSPVEGLLVYNTTTNNFEYYDANTSQWFAILSEENSSADSWALTGNSGTSPGTNYLGTNDTQPLLFYTNSSERMRIAINGSVGIGTNNPLNLFSVGASSEFQINSSGQINTATGINSSGNIIFSDLTQDEFVRTTTGGQLATFSFSQDLDITPVGVATVTGLQSRDVAATLPTDGQVLTWNNTDSRWEPSTVAVSGGNTLEQAYNQGGAGAGRTVNANSGAIVFTSTSDANLSLEVNQSGNAGALLVDNTGTGNSFRVNDEASDTTPFLIDDEGNVGIKNDNPTRALDVNGTFRLGEDGTGHKYIISETVDLTIPSISPNDSQTVTATVTGAETGSTVIVSPEASLGNNVVIAFARVSAANTVSITFTNVRDSGSAVSLGTLEFYITVIK